MSEWVCVYMNKTHTGMENMILDRKQTTNNKRVNYEVLVGILTAVVKMLLF
jgi:hypothetical protein